MYEGRSVKTQHGKAYAVSGTCCPCSFCNSALPKVKDRVGEPKSRCRSSMVDTASGSLTSPLNRPFLLQPVPHIPSQHIGLSNGLSKQVIAAQLRETTLS